MTDLRHLEHFVAVYRHRSFRAGAAELGVTQSAVTKTIRMLEADLQIRLFNRTTRTVEPTDTARELIGKAEQVLQAASGFRDEAQLLAAGEIGSLRVGAIALASETLIAGALARLAQSHPSLEVEVVVGSTDVYRDLATGLCDVVVGDESNFASSSHAHNLRMLPVLEEALVFLHRREHPARASKDLSSLLAYPLAVPSRYFNENRLFASILSTTGGFVVPRYRLNNLSSCLSLARSCDVITLAPRSVVDQAVDYGLVMAAQQLDIYVHLALVTVANNALTPAVRAFQQALVSR